MGKYKKYVVLSGLMMMNSVIGIGTYYGNLSTYIYSIDYFYSSSDSGFDIGFSAVLPAYLVSKALGSFVAHFIERKVGLKYTSGFGVLLYLFSIGMTYFAVRHSIWATTLTLMVGGGIACGIVSVTNYLHVANWFPSKVGVASAVSASANAIGGALINVVITTFINPGNIKTDMERYKMTFFSQRAVIDRIPWVFLVIAALAAGIQVPGFLLVPKHPPETSLPREDSTSSSTDASVIRKQTQQGRETTQNISEKGAHPNQQTDSCQTSHQTTRAIGCVNDDPSLDGLDMPPRDSSYLIEDKEGLPPSKIIKTETFYLLQFAIISIALGLVVAENYYKLFGQLWIRDDHFLAVVGSCSALSSNMFFIGCGFLMDRLGNKRTLVAHLATSSFFTCLWYFTARANRWLYLVCTVVIYSVHNNLNILFSLSTMKVFGTRHFAINFGIAQIGSLIVFVVSPPIVTAIIHSLGWFWLFFSVGSVSFLSLILVILRFPSK